MIETWAELGLFDPSDDEEALRNIYGKLTDRVWSWSWTYLENEHELTPSNDNSVRIEEAI